MGKLIKFELRKVGQQKSFYICFGLSYVLLILGAFMSKSLGLPHNMLALSSSAIGDSSFLSLLAIFIALYVCDDFTNHTLKNIYGKGYGRLQVYSAKYLVSLVVTMVNAVLCMGVALVLGAIIGTSQAGINAQLFASLGLQLLMVMAFHAVYFGLAFVISNIGGSIALNLLGPSLVVTVIDIVLSLLKIKFSVASYWLNHQMSVLETAVSVKIAVKTVLMWLGYTVAFVAGGFWFSRRKEV